MSADPLFRDLRRVLAARTPTRLGDPPAGVLPASVLVPLFEKDGETHLLFVKRPEGEYRHAGQMAFPGGKRDGDETVLECALREAEEEVGIVPEHVEILGELDEYDTVVTGFRVTPVVGIIPFPYDFRPQEREVERILQVPLTTLLDPAIFRREERHFRGHDYPIYYYSVGRDLIWGVTAGMMTPLLEIIRGLPSRPRL